MPLIRSNRGCSRAFCFVCGSDAVHDFWSLSLSGWKEVPSLREGANIVGKAIEIPTSVLFSAVLARLIG